MKAIVAVDSNWGIGYKGQLLERITEDMKNFKALTFSKTIVMGRETFDSLPNKSPLSGRINIALSRNEEFLMDNLDKNMIILNSIDNLHKALIQYNLKEIFVIGGQSIYEQLLPLCDEVYVTKIQNKYKADRYFPNLDVSDEWFIETEGETRWYNDINYKFITYKRIKQI